LQKLPLTLEELNVSIPGGENISQPLSKFRKLRKLGIYNDDYSGAFNTITNHTFEPLKNITIEELTIVAYNLSRVEPLAFSYFPELKSLSIGGIYWFSVPDFYPALIGLNQTKLEKLRLSSKLDFEGIFYYYNRGITVPGLVALNDSFCENLDLRI
jgi:hypothetical protein